MKITNKQQMYALQSQLRLGNSLFTFPTIEDVRKSDYDGLIAIRSLVPGNKMQTHIAQDRLEKATEEYLKSRHLSQGQIRYSEMAAPSMGIQRLLNAELARFECGLYLAWCDENIHLPEAMKKAKIDTGITAKLVLEHFLDPSDVNDLEVLLEQYPDSVIELSNLSKRVGWAQRKMVVWEVRNY